MRLHRLRVTAFQAFAGSEEVDFDALGESGLFLLHGDTGAGKTTLLDAVCFALYGDVPGARARDARLRSDHAEADTRTEVELDVTLRDRRLRIVRRPAQERPKVRGEGMTKELHTCTVQELGDDGDWSVLASRPDEARAELADLLGMTCEQFCQVVLLPQGEFATFLRSDSTDRQAVLERLFGTDRFTRVEHWLTERRKAAASELREHGQTVRDLVSRVAQASAAEPPEELDEVRAWVGDLGVAAQADAATAAESATAARAVRVEAERSLAEGSALAERRTRHAAVVTELAAWEGRRPARDAAEAELAAARRAAPVAALLAGAHVSAASVGKVPPFDGGAHVRTGYTGTNVRSSSELRSHAAELRSQAGALDALVAVEGRLATSEAELRALDTQANEAAKTAETAARALSKAADQRVSLDAAVTGARTATERAERLTAETQATHARAEAAVKRDGLTADHATAADRVRTAVDAEQATRAAWLDLRERRLAGMAAELAGALEPDEPCAVCGSVEHPSPAMPSLLDAPLGDQEQTAEREHATQEQARIAAASALAEIEARLAAARAVAGDEPAAQLTATAERLAAELATVRAQASTLTQAEQALTALSLDVERNEQARREAAQVETAARATHAERTGALTADRERVVQARAGHASIAERATALRDEAKAAEAQADTAEAVARATQAAANAGFLDLLSAHAAIRDEAAQQALEQRLRDYDAGLAERRTRTQEPELIAATAGPAPDVPALTARAAATTAEEREAATRDTLAQDRLKALTRLAGELDEALEALAPVAERERRVRELAALVDGSSVSNRLRMRLSAYVLAARLEEVAAAATVRLERMSNGRYQLVHSDEGARGRTRGGLELRIVDGWTGSERAPSTLSGGETFLASLALALGLADVVAAEAGGSRLETLFIDEGFGSLDERTLDEVLDVLDGLREGGRVVGIVSHVAELRQRIPARLHVVKGRDGSHVEQRDAATV